MAKVLVVGGAGYVGSAACARLLDRGHEPCVLDDLSTGHRELVIPAGFTPAHAGDAGALKELFAREKFDCVMHFAARSLVGESFDKRDEYFENNVAQTEVLLRSMLAAGIRCFVFSSSCAVFGDPGTQTINESLPRRPINPYGETKAAVEDLLAALARTDGLQAIALRYFNAAGAEPQLRVGEWHLPETHLIPNILRAAIAGDPVRVNGSDYPTRDGTCVRDYVHVTDLADAHLAAMERMLARRADGGASGSGGSSGSAGKFEAFNLGSEQGFSVLEVIKTCERVTGRALRIEQCPRRPGDPPTLVADSALARRELAFSPRARALDECIESAWKWEQKLRQPRKAVFLDRDGTLNIDPGYISDPAQLQLLPGAGEGLARLKSAGYLLVVVSNQSGVARGLIDPAAVPRINARLNELLLPFGVKIDHFEMCFHHPHDACGCRKPKPKLLTDAARTLGIDLAASFMVGDKASDLRAGAAAGCNASLLIRTGEGRATEKALGADEKKRPAFIGDRLTDLADWILRTEDS